MPSVFRLFYKRPCRFFICDKRGQSFLRVASTDYRNFTFSDGSSAAALTIAYFAIIFNLRRTAPICFFADLFHTAIDGDRFLRLNFFRWGTPAYFYKRRISALRSALFRSRTSMYAPVNKCSCALTCLFLKIGKSCFP